MAKSKARAGDQNLSSSEQARDYKRDRKMSAQARAGMNTGAAKQFKTVADTVARRGREAAEFLEKRKKTKSAKNN